ncbi:MAG: hypothetical protein IPJ30_12690 [Acidobacteria bacterium]|nr:hypothetical protein [Acidobacteriota bacterium]
MRLSFTREPSRALQNVRISLVWTDPPAATTPALINNLDLTVQIGASTYRGNVFSGGNSTAGGANSTIDNVENVFLSGGHSRGNRGDDNRLGGGAQQRQILETPTPPTRILRSLPTTSAKWQ